MDVLRRRFGVDGNALSWVAVAEFLSNRRQVVYAGKSESDNISLHFGVPQGSVLGPRVFMRSTSRTFSNVMKYVTICLLTTCRVTVADDSMTFFQLFLALIESCIADIYVWRGAKRLQLNAEKTELLWFGSVSQLRHAAAITEQCRPCQPVRRQASDCRLRPGCVVRR